MAKILSQLIMIFGTRQQLTWVVINITRTSSATYTTQVVHHDAMPIMKKINMFFLLKPDSVGDPNMYLGSKIKYHKNPNGVWYWKMSPSKYVREACKNFKDNLSNNFDDKYKLPKQAPNPFVMGYESELDTSTLCDPEEA